MMVTVMRAPGWIVPRFAEKVCPRRSMLPALALLWPRSTSAPAGTSSVRRALVAMPLPAFQMLMVKRAVSPGLTSLWSTLFAMRTSLAGGVGTCVERMTDVGGGAAGGGGGGGGGGGTGVAEAVAPLTGLAEAGTPMLKLKREPASPYPSACLMCS